jgi:hypothetical protein
MGGLQAKAGPPLRYGPTSVITEKALIYGYRNAGKNTA